MLGFTQETSVQFIDAGTSTLVCLATAEGYGETDADDIRIGMTRALDAAFAE